MRHFAPSTAHRWKFHRIGGLDQVALETGDDLLALDQLDQKLWVALSCPVKGLALDEKTLALIDTDGDGRIRVPELLAAIRWAAARLKDPGDLLKGSEVLPLAAINETTPDGSIVLASARQVLANIGGKDDVALSVEHTADTARIFAANPLNGDGVIPPGATNDEAVEALIADILETVGGEPDRVGALGVSAAKLDAFFAELAAYAAWAERGNAGDVAPLGAATGVAYEAIQAVRAKVDDYFARSRLAAFDSRAVDALNRSESDYEAIAAKAMTLAAEEVAAFPLARVEAGRPLPLLEGVNPAWAGALATLYNVAVVPWLGASRTALVEGDWRALTGRFRAYETWLDGKAGAAVEKLGLPRVRVLLDGPERAALRAWIDNDRAREPEFAAITAVDRLVRYHRDLRALLHNFVNFADFYSPQRWATFQAGTLYLDSRSCELCVRVDDPAAHAGLAVMSKAYIAYLDCRRQGETMKIAACFTQGDSDYLFTGRNGVFYDRGGRDWHATIVKIVDNPISVREAFWTPYKKVLRMIEEQVAKRAAAAEAASTEKMQQTATVTTSAEQKPAEAPKRFDVGTVAALGVGIGAVGTVIATMFAKFVDIPGWQIPLVLLGIVLLISLPSMVIAWLKLRQRNLGPILEANGWAVNGRVKINIPFGRELTDRALLPRNARRVLEDPYDDKPAKRRKRLFWLLLVLLIAATITARILETWPFAPPPAEPATTSAEGKAEG